MSEKTDNPSLAQDSETKMGRPTEYTKELGTKICDLIASGLTIRKVCDELKKQGIGVNKSQITRWRLSDPTMLSKKLIELLADFRVQYAQALEIRAENWADESVDIADDGSNDWMDRETRNGTIRVVDHEHVSRSKIRIETRAWYLEKLLPKKYGKRVAQEVSGPEGGPIQFVDRPSEESFEQWLKRRSKELQPDQSGGKKSRSKP